MYKLLLTLLLLSGVQQNKPTMYLTGDSTVKNGKDNGDNEQWGWGHFLADHLKIPVVNRALGGTSSRTYQTRGLWDSVLLKLKPGDYVLIQFGHNDGGPLDDTARARGTIRGVGDESKEIFNPITQRQEVVHTYGWYLSKMIREAKGKGAVPIVCSPIPRNMWKDGKVARASADYGLWAKITAEKEAALFIDLNALIADVYDREGEAKVSAAYFGTKDHTHTLEAGAKLNAEEVAAGLKSLKNVPLKRYVK